jgi:hypothetical protein
VLTGFLGSGKTTFVNHLLREAHGLKVAIIENEYGETAIDDGLILRSSEEVGAVGRRAGLMPVGARAAASGGARVQWCRCRCGAGWGRVGHTGWGWGFQVGPGGPGRRQKRLCRRGGLGGTHGPHPPLLLRLAPCLAPSPR